MSRDRKVKRKTFAAREDLLNRLSDLASARGQSLYSLVNQLFTLALRADALHLNLDRLIDEQGILESARDAGFILVHEGLWRDVTTAIHHHNAAWATTRWRDTGAWLAKRYLTSGHADPFAAFQTNLTAYLWNIAELTIQRDDTGVSIRLISPRISAAQATLYAALFEGALTAFGYTMTSREVAAGAVRLRAEGGST